MHPLKREQTSVLDFFHGNDGSYYTQLGADTPIQLPRPAAQPAAPAPKPGYGTLRQTLLPEPTADQSRPITCHDVVGSLAAMLWQIVLLSLLAGIAILRWNAELIKFKHDTQAVVGQLLLATVVLGAMVASLMIQVRADLSQINFPSMLVMAIMGTAMCTVAVISVVLDPLATGDVAIVITVAVPLMLLVATGSSAFSSFWFRQETRANKARVLYENWTVLAPIITVLSAAVGAFELYQSDLDYAPSLICGYVGLCILEVFGIFRQCYEGSDYYTVSSSSTIMIATVTFIMRSALAVALVVMGLRVNVMLAGFYTPLILVAILLIRDDIKEGYKPKDSRLDDSDTLSTIHEDEETGSVVGVKKGDNPEDSRLDGSDTLSTINEDEETGSVDGVKKGDNPEDSRLGGGASAIQPSDTLRTIHEDDVKEGDDPGDSRLGGGASAIQPSDTARTIHGDDIKGGDGLDFDFVHARALMHAHEWSLGTLPLREGSPSGVGLAGPPRASGFNPFSHLYDGPIGKPAKPNAQKGRKSRKRK